MVGDDPYADAGLYDLEYADMVEDVAFYVDRARVAGGPVVELGCGSGRLTVPIARAGVQVTGVDRAEDMLRALSAKLAREPEVVRERVRCVRGDYRAVELPEAAFAAVLWPFNALHHTTDEEDLCAILRRIRGWIRPGGRLVLDCYLPDRELYDHDPEDRYEGRTFVDPRTGEPLESWEQGWWDEASRVHHVIYVYRRPDGSERRTHLQLRMYEIDELRAAIRDAGFDVVREASDFHGRPTGPGTLKWVAALRPYSFAGSG